MIELRNITKSFPTKLGRYYVFRDFSAVLPEGKSVGIIGRNGAGKSTLLRLLGGIDRPDSGEVITNKRISWPVGLRGGGHQKLTGREVARFVCHLYEDDRARIPERIEWIKEFSELGEHFDLETGTYSSGMGGRLGFALSMAFDFDYYLIDEITAVGDRFFRDKSKEELDRKRERACVLMVSHSLNTLKDFCDIGIVIEKGKVIAIDEVDAAVKVYNQLKG